CLERLDRPAVDHQAHDLAAAGSLRDRVRPGDRLPADPGTPLAARGGPGASQEHRPALERVPTGSASRPAPLLAPTTPDPHAHSEMSSEIPLVTRGALTLCCSDMAAPPLFWTEADGTRHGYEPGAAGAVAEAMGLEVHWIFRQWADFA